MYPRVLGFCHLFKFYTVQLVGTVSGISSQISIFRIFHLLTENLNLFFPSSFSIGENNCVVNICFSISLKTKERAAPT